VALDIQKRCDPKEAQHEDQEALHKVRESCPDSYHGCPSLSPAAFSCLYSPKCVEVEFSEVRLYGVLRSSHNHDSANFALTGFSEVGMRDRVVCLGE
jgi:hypothetical protein